MVSSEGWPGPGRPASSSGWPGYSRLEALGYRHDKAVTGGDRDRIEREFPRVHRVAALLKRWLLGTHQGAVENQHLDYYLDEFTFRFNRRTSRSRGLLFYRLMQQAVATAPVPRKTILRSSSAQRIARESRVESITYLITHQPQPKLGGGSFRVGCQADIRADVFCKGDFLGFLCTW